MECVYRVDAGMMAVQWVVSMPSNCSEDQVPLHFSADQKSPWGPWIGLVLLIESCATIKLCVWGGVQLVIILVLFWEWFC